MVDNIEKTVHDKTTRLNNPETYMLTHKRFNTSLVLIFSDLNKSQIYEKPYRYSSHNEIEILLSFDYLNVFKPNEYTENYHIRKANDEKFLFEIGDKKNIFVGEKVFSFETNDIMVKYNSDHGFNYIKFINAYGEENVYFMLHQKYISIQKYEISTKKRV